MNKKVLMALVGMSALYWWVMRGQKTANKTTFTDMGQGVTMDEKGNWWKGGQIIYMPKQEWTA